VLTGAFVNESALLDVLGRGSEDVVLVAAGMAGKPSLEDMAFCGALTNGLLNLDTNCVPDHAAVITLGLWKKWQDDIPGLLATSPHGTWLAAHGFAADLDVCARRDSVDVVPVLESGRLIPVSSTNMFE
jgi:2-phosphosulfolactate phosphatase